MVVDWLPLGLLQVPLKVLIGSRFVLCGVECSQVERYSLSNDVVCSRTAEVDVPAIQRTWVQRVCRFVNIRAGPGHGAAWEARVHDAPTGEGDGVAVSRDPGPGLVLPGLHAAAGCLHTRVHQAASGERDWMLDRRGRL